jgi:dissimilatory sulfite reductase (desulfoviridin) alpha/beta subunit
MDSYFKLKESNCKNCHKCIRHCHNRDSWDVDGGAEFSVRHVIPR